MLCIIGINNHTRKDVVDLIKENWSGPIIVTKGKIHDVNNLPGFVAIEDGRLIGAITYCIENDACEIITLDSLTENHGIGTELINMVSYEAVKAHCKKMWLVTTNDNIHAIRFYQRRGFDMTAIHINAIQEARKIKPEIPKYGMDDLLILHEIEFEKTLEGM